MEVDVALFLLLTFLLGDLDLDLGSTTALVILDGGPTSTAALDFLTAGAIVHLVVEFDILIFVVERNIDFTDRKVLVALDFVGVFLLLDFGADASAIEGAPFQAALAKLAAALPAGEVVALVLADVAVRKVVKIPAFGLVLGTAVTVV